MAFQKATEAMKRHEVKLEVNTEMLAPYVLPPILALMCLTDLACSLLEQFPLFLDEASGRLSLKEMCFHLFRL